MIDYGKASMVMPVKNAGKYLNLMLESIYSQTYENIEYIAAYDSSEDNTMQILRSWESKFKNKGYDFKIIENTYSGGIPAGLNAAIPFYTGEYICFPDADDYMYPDYVESMVSALHDNKEYGWVCCNAIRVRETDGMEDDGGYKRCINTIYRDVDYPLHALLDLEWRAPWNIMVRRDFFDRSFPDKTIFPHPISHELAIRLPLLCQGKYLYLDKVLYRYILHDDGFVGAAMNSLMGSIRYLDSMEMCGENVICSLHLPAEKRNKYILANKINYLSNKFKETSRFRADRLGSLYLEELFRCVCEFDPEINNYLEEFRPFKFEYTFSECAAGIAAGIVPVRRSELKLMGIIKEGNYILYGYGRCGKSYLAALEDIGYPPVEIWDKSVDGSDSNKGIPVLIPHKGFDNKIPILLSVANLELQLEIVCELKTKGYTEVIMSEKVHNIIRLGMLEKYFKNAICFVEDE